MSTGSDFLPPDEMTLEAAGDALIRHLLVRERPAVQSDRTFYDTFDGLLRDAGVLAVHENGRLALIDRATAAERAAMAMPQPTQPLLAFQLDDGPLRTALEPLVEVRALLPLVHVHSRVRAL